MVKLLTGVIAESNLCVVPKIRIKSKPNFLFENIKKLIETIKKDTVNM